MLVQVQRILNGLMVLVLCGVLLSAYGVQFFWHEVPCPLCLLQRIAMIGVAIGAALNVWYGVHPFHYALCILSSISGGAVALRQISLHACPGFAPPYGLPVLGLSLYTWSFFVFTCVVFAVGVLLILYNPKDETRPIAHSWFDKLACGALLFITFANMVSTFIQCGLGPCAD